MKTIDNIKAKIQHIEYLLAEIQGELEVLSKEGQMHRKKARTGEPLPCEEELRAHYERLYQEFTARNSKAIEEFIKGKNKIYLKAFCKANNLPVDTSRVSKDGVLNEVMQWFAQRRAITSAVT